MEGLYNQKKELIASKMNNHNAKGHTLSSKHSNGILSLIEKLTESNTSCKTGKDTQSNATENEKTISGVLKDNMFQEANKQKKSSSNTINIDVYQEDYYGYERTVSHPNNCIVQRPSADGLYYIQQPCGSQASPDFLTFHYEQGNVISTFAFEFKGSSGGVKWNAHIQSMSRSILYIIKSNNKTYCLFGEQIRNKESLLHALTHDELLRDLVRISNNTSINVKHLHIARPSHEFKGINLDDNYDIHYNKNKTYLESFIKS